MAKISSLVDNKEKVIYPKTVVEAVYTKDGTALSDRIDNMAILGSPVQECADIKIINADYLNGHTKDYFATKEEVDKLLKISKDLDLNSIQLYYKYNFDEMSVEEQFKYMFILTHSEELHSELGYWIVVNCSMVKPSGYMCQTAIGTLGMAHRFIYPTDGKYITTKWTVTVSKEYLDTYCKTSSFTRLTPYKINGVGTASGFIKKNLFGVEAAIGFNHKDGVNYEYIVSNDVDDCIQKDLYTNSNILGLEEFDGTASTMYRLGVTTVELIYNDSSEPTLSSCILGAAYVDGVTYIGHTINKHKKDLAKIKRADIHSYVPFPLVTFRM